MDVPFGKEVIFMSSGTTDKVKLCAYTAENFYYQVCDSADIIEESPDIQKHFDGEIKQLALLPFYHVFGFIAVYIWFGFFSRTFVFLKDMNPSTLLNTVKKHKVTHIFAVPLVWETIYKEAMRKIKGKGEKTYKKFRKALKIANSTGKLGKSFAKAALGEVREGIFGDSICCLITGGSPVRREVLEFFNGIGYHLANGYGMTEIGITSVEVSTKQKQLNNGSIGHSFGHTEYSISDQGELLVRGKTKASRIIIGETSLVTSPDEWFGTNDLAREINGQYFLEGRIDDLIICENGENLNPVLAEAKLKVNGCDRLCLFADKRGVPTLIASAPGCLSPEKLSELTKALDEAVRGAKLEGEIKKIVITTDSLIQGSEFKVSRRKVAERYENGKIRAIDTGNIEKQIAEILSHLESDVRECFAEALEKNACEIETTDNFFTALGGTSLDYFTLLSLVKSRFNVEMPSDEGNRLTTVKEFCDYIRKN
jgi:acyl carrier protein